jgi:hypothetical protein
MYSEIDIIAKAENVIKIAIIKYYRKKMMIKSIIYGNVEKLEELYTKTQVKFTSNDEVYYLSIFNIGKELDCGKIKTVDCFLFLLKNNIYWFPYIKTVRVRGDLYSFGFDTISDIVAFFGHTDILIYLYENSYTVNAYTLYCAIHGKTKNFPYGKNNMECIQYLISIGISYHDEYDLIFDTMIESDDLQVLKYLIGENDTSLSFEKKNTLNDEYYQLFSYAIYYGSYDCLVYLHEELKCDFSKVDNIDMQVELLMGGPYNHRTKEYITKKFGI